MYFLATQMLVSLLTGQVKPPPRLSREFVLLEEPKNREEVSKRIV